MIIWLASYPKSGNTWVRSIISSLIYTKDGIFDMKILSQIPQFPKISQFKDFSSKLDDIHILKKYWIKAQEKINLDNKLYFFKTHNANIKIDTYPFTNNKNTAGTIYIVRDPRNIINSLGNHFDLSQEEARNFLFSKEILSEKNKDNNKILTLVGTWEEHYNSWTMNNDNLLLIKYEDLINNIEVEVLKIVKFILKYAKISINNEKIRNVIETTNFKSLRKMEDMGQFKEYRNKDFKFFNKGPDNKWEDNLNKNIREEIENKYKISMKKLGYL